MYQQYEALIHAELLGSKRLKEKDLKSIVAGIVLLYYGSTHRKQAKLTATLYHSLSAWQWLYTTWFAKHNVKDSQQLFFMHTPAWIHFPGNIGLHFLVAACSSNDWNELLFAAVVQHTHCPLCGQAVAGPVLVGSIISATALMWINWL